MPTQDNAEINSINARMLAERVQQAGPTDWGKLFQENTPNKPFPNPDTPEWWELVGQVIKKEEVVAQFNLQITLEYDLIVSEYPTSLAQKVNDWISEGWQPLGGAFVYEGDICQTMVREKPKSVAEKITDEIAKFEEVARY